MKLTLNIRPLDLRFGAGTGGWAWVELCHMALFRRRSKVQQRAKSSKEAERQRVIVLPQIALTMSHTISRNNMCGLKQ
jgi:hypothetical protein